METRLSPSMSHLLSMAKRAQFPVPDRVSKPELHQLLNEHMGNAANANNKLSMPLATKRGRGSGDGTAERAGASRSTKRSFSPPRSRPSRRRRRQRKAKRRRVDANQTASAAGDSGGGGSNNGPPQTLVIIGPQHPLTHTQPGSLPHRPVCKVRLADAPRSATAVDEINGMIMSENMAEVAKTTPMKVAQNEINPIGARNRKRNRRKNKKSKRVNRQAGTSCGDGDDGHANNDTNDENNQPTSSRRRKSSGALAARTRRKTKTKVKAKAKTASPTVEFDESMDPITREPLGKHVFPFKRPNGLVVRFNATSLVDYMLATGDFCDPESRLPFTDQDLRALDSAAALADADGDADANADADARNIGATSKRPSVLEAKLDKERQRQYADAAQRRDAVLGVERCAGELVSEMLTLVEAVVDGSVAPDDAETELLLRLFPMFANYFQSIAQVDQEYALQCASQYKSFVRGPPNRPTRNVHGTRDVVLNFLDQVGRGNASTLTELGFQQS